MYTSEDLKQIYSRGSQPGQIDQQIENFKNGFPFIKLIETATNYHGISKLSEEQIEWFTNIFEQKKLEGISILKFVPASGASTRMFKSLFSALEKLKSGETIDHVRREKDVAVFFDRLDKFAFFSDLYALLPFGQKPQSEKQAMLLLETLLLNKGLNYSNKPKALLKFHKYPEQNRTPFEEHLVEGALYASNKNIVNLHFTVSLEHEEALKNLVGEIKGEYENKFGVAFEISFSNQKPSTDAVAVTIENDLFRTTDGSLLFRPAGHGALIENLNDMTEDIIFIKNIDNVVPDSLKQTTIKYKKAIAGVLLHLQEQIFSYQRLLDSHSPNDLESGFYAEITDFIENVLNVSPPKNLIGSNKEELYNYVSKKINRPIRICGMVENTGEPGGGPFFTLNSDGTVSPQIVESSQVNFKDPKQAGIFSQSTHFNPVDIVCGIKNYKGLKYNLTDFVDHQTGLITTKSSDGKELKAQELPGLWNGSMSDWNTLFVEVPIETFSPVKTVSDLLRKEHLSD